MMEAALLTSAGILNSPTIPTSLLLIAPLERNPLRDIILSAAPSLAAVNVGEAMSLMPELVGEKKAKPNPTPPTTPDIVINAGGDGSTAARSGSRRTGRCSCRRW